MSIAIRDDYDERVYAGVLGKIIAVYLGRPFEGWTYERIMAELGEITYYVNDRTDLPLKNHLLVVTDDDITGTLVFPRALRDLGPGGFAKLTSQDVGRAWLNYIIENVTVLWWGGMGNSTEHTAYLRMKAGIQPLDSGSIARNGRVVAEQVGAQIFCEGFAMTCPGDPAAAADLVEAAARVSHDGEAINAARVVGALVASAFTETDMDAALDTAMGLIPGDSLIHRVINDVRGWAQSGDWHATRARIAERYGYDRYGGNCHVVPNHAVVIAALAHSQGNFAQAMTVVNTCGWDTDSNAGDVGSICGVFGGLAGLDAGPDWRGPVADRIYLPTADGGAAITDAATEALTLAALGRDRAGLPATERRGGARFHFTLPGSVQGFAAAATDDTTAGTVANVLRDAGDRALRIGWPAGDSVLAATPTFTPEEAIGMTIYALVACPTLYPGQHLSGRVAVPADAAGPVDVRLAIRTLGEDDRPVTLTGPSVAVQPGDAADLAWVVPNTAGQPVVSAGVLAAGGGVADLESLTWSGEPRSDFTRPAGGGGRWRTAWVQAVDRFDAKWPEPFRIVQNRGTGLLIHGSRDWRNYRVDADVTPHMAAAVGLAARVQGLTRYYALELAGRSTVRLVRRWDEDEAVLASADLAWEFGRRYQLTLQADGRALTAAVDGTELFHVTDDGPGPDSGGIALLVTEGRTATERVSVGECTTSD
jgi:ADP-ribosylglycohydrolase